ncbi:MAG: PspA/IM30 family protein [Cyanobacteria bacterium J06592_8]
MKQFIYWLMGERAGRVTISTWNWLWGIPNESAESQISLETAEESLQLMRESIKKLEAAVLNQRSTYERALQKYREKQAEIATLEQEAVTAQDNGDEYQTRLAMAKVIQIEKILPQLEQQVQRAENYLNLSQEQLNQERIKLETYQTDLANLRDMQEINAALDQVAQVNNQFDTNSARSQLNEIKNTVEQRSLEQQAIAELTLNTDEKLGSDIDNLAAEDEIARRLERLRKSRQPSD